MSEAVLVALITGGFMLVGTILTTRKSNADLYAKLDKQSELADQKIEAKLDEYRTVTDIKIEELTREVRDHNGFAREIPLIKARVDVLEKAAAK